MKSGGRVGPDFKEGWGLMFGFGGFGKPHYWYKKKQGGVRMYYTLCGWEVLLTPEGEARAGLLEPGDFIATRCKHCDKGLKRHVTN